jgi:hypothetical protein
MKMQTAHRNQVFADFFQHHNGKYYEFMHVMCRDVEFMPYMEDMSILFGLMEAISKSGARVEFSTTDRNRFQLVIGECVYCKSTSPYAAIYHGIGNFIQTGQKVLELLPDEFYFSEFKRLHKIAHKEREWREYKGDKDLIYFLLQSGNEYLGDGKYKKIKQQ